MLRLRTAIYAASESSNAEKSISEQERNATLEGVLNESYLTTLHIGIAFPHQPGILGQFLQAPSRRLHGAGPRPESRFVVIIVLVVVIEFPAEFLVVFQFE